jgi:hypothetical protein
VNVGHSLQFVPSTLTQIQNSAASQSTFLQRAHELQ